MELSLGDFGDERLTKGGPFCMGALLGMAAGVSASGGWAATAPARCGSRGFCTIPRWRSMRWYLRRGYVPAVRSVGGTCWPFRTRRPCGWTRKALGCPSTRSSRLMPIRERHLGW